MARDYTKYNVEGLGENLNKRKLVFTIVKDWAEKNNPSLEEIQTAFPDEVQGGKGFIVKESEVKDAKLFNIKEPLTIKNNTQILVSNQWGENISKFIPIVEKLGYKISAEENRNEENEWLPDEDAESKKILIEISGRMSTYMFGVMEEEYYLECKQAFEYTSDAIESLSRFIQTLYNTTQDNGFDTGIEKFKKNIDMDKFSSNCPLLYEFICDVENGDANYYDFYDTILDVSREQIHLFEEDASITIYEEDEIIFPEVSINDFLSESESIWLEDDKIAEKTATSLWSKNSKKFNIEMDSLEYAEVSKASNGVLVINAWIEPESLNNYQVTDRNVTIEHDCDVNFSFSFDAANFNLSKLAFLKYANGGEFHKSGSNYIGSYLSYDGEIIDPELNIYEEIELHIEYEGKKSCNYFLFG